LLIMRAALAVASKSRKRSSCARMPRALASISSIDSSERSAVLPLGSPIIPVPPPTSAIGECPWRCSRASAMIGSSDPTCRLDAVGSKPM
jgi:hypothetical protein